MREMAGMCGAPGRGFALDHLTVVDATPPALVELAANHGYTGVCAFLHGMDVLPHMPAFDLVADTAMRRDLRRALSRTGTRLELAYPFTLSRATDMAAMQQTLDCAADLGANCVNLLSYDRDPGQRIDRFGTFCDLAGTRGLKVALEFFPRSAVPSLADGLMLVGAIDRPGQVGVNVDLLHLVRSDGRIGDLASAPAGHILYAQLCDGPAACPDIDRDHEASAQRRLIGEGVFDVAAFVGTLPPDCPVSLEIPRDAAIAAGQSPAARALAAIDSARAALPCDHSRG